MTTVLDMIDDGVEAALLTIGGIDMVDIEPSGEPDTFPNLAIFQGSNRLLEREAGLQRREMILRVEGTIERGDGREARAERNALHAETVRAIMEDETLGGVVELIEPGDTQFTPAPFASVERLMFSQDFLIQFVTNRTNPALPA